MAEPPALELELASGGPYDLGRSLLFQRFGRGDPTASLGEDGFWKATRVAGAPVVLHVRVAAGGVVVVRAWGEGATALDEAACAAFAGTADAPTAFRPAHPKLLRLHRARLGVRLTRALSLSEIHLATIFQQRVRFADAARAYRVLTERFGERAPGPRSLVLPLTPARWAATPSHVLAELGVDRKRYEAIVLAARHARHVEAIAPGDVAELRRVLALARGTGPWTLEMVAGFGAADRDAVPTGDVHLPHTVCKFFEGRLPGSDARMLELLEPFRGERFRVVRLVSEG